MFLSLLYVSLPLFFRVAFRLVSVMIPMVGFGWLIGIFLMFDETSAVWLHYLFSIVNSLQVNIWEEMLC